MSKKIEALTMPKWGIEMEEGKLTEWMIEDGSSFSKGDPLLVVETDKISNEIVNKVKGINRVVYDISSKPPSTIELE